MVRATAAILRTRLALSLAAAIAVMAVLGVIAERSDGLDAFDLDGELNIPAFFSAALLGAAALAAWRARRTAGWTVVFALLFAFMAGDELSGLHEELADRVGVRWPVLYAPLIVAAGVAWLMAMRSLLADRHPAALLLGGGAAAWFVAQLLEAVQWKDGEHVAGYYPMMYAEETLEMAGSALFLLAFVALGAARRGMMSECAPPSASPRQPLLSR